MQKVDAAELFLLGSLTPPETLIIGSRLNGGIEMRRGFIKEKSINKSLEM